MGEAVGPLLENMDVDMDDLSKLSITAGLDRSTVPRGAYDEEGSEKKELDDEDAADVALSGARRDRRDCG